MFSLWDIIWLCIPGMKLMRWGRISVKGEAEENSISPRPRSGQKHGKRPNPYSTLGRDRFESVYAELSTKREYIAKKTGAPEALVRFAYSNNEWIPIVVRPGEGFGNKNGGLDVAGASGLGPLEKNNEVTDGELRRNYEGNDIHGRSKNISISRFDERNHSLVMSSSRFLEITTSGVLGLIAIWMRRAAISAAAAIAVLMAVGNVMCIKKFILTRVSYFTTLFRNPKTSQIEGGVEEIAELIDVSKVSRRKPVLGLSVSTPNSLLRAHVQPIQFSSSASPRTAKQKKIDRENMNHQSKSKNFRRAVSMGNQPTRSPRPQDSDSFRRRTSPAMANDCCFGATVIIITLLCLVFYGRFCAILLLSAWWYLFPLLLEQRMIEMKRNDNSRTVDLQSNEYKMKVIMDGFLQRKHKS